MLNLSNCLSANIVNRADCIDFANPTIAIAIGIACICIAAYYIADTL